MEEAEAQKQAEIEEAERVRSETEARLAAEAEEQARIEEEQRQAALAELAPKKENEKAFAHFEKCVNGDAASCSKLGWIYIWGQDAAKDKVKAMSLFSLACDRDFVDGCIYLGRMYVGGGFEGGFGDLQGIPKNTEKALSLFSQECDVGHAAACVELGYMYDMGNGVIEDKAKAVSLFNR